MSAEPSEHHTAPGATAAAIHDELAHHPAPGHTVSPQATDANVPHTHENGAVGVGAGPQVVSTSDALEVHCGPLLNYRKMSGVASGRPTWHGSVLIVTTPGQVHPQLLLRELGAVDGSAGPASAETRSFDALKLYEDPGKAFWRFRFDVPYLDYEARWEYQIPKLKPVGEATIDGDPTKRVFAVPSIAQSMRILFHSCNGFSVGTDVDAWSGPALWNDVNRIHATKPFHVMIGGGDQIYNDGVRVDGPLKAWTDIGNPKKRQHFPFNEQLRAECDEYYYKNYVRWYTSRPFSDANGQIPQLNIWDDHDIIDGFGSYTDHFMRCAVFRGIGGVAHKYYLLFQHHLPPPKSTFTTDAPKTVEPGPDGTPADPVQIDDTFVAEETEEQDSYIIGAKPGPYVEERSRSIYCQLGARIAFLGIDARTERTRHQVNYPETYELIFNRVKKEFSENREIKHLVLLLGVPIAYPRLQWLENVFQSPIIGPIRFMNKRFGLAGSFFNHFDGQVDLLDDLDDHYTARHHKAERKELILRLQDIAKEYSVRVTILGGDVHLAALGRFYSNPALKIPIERDHRYMINIVSSAITNKPPPQPVANLLARRNKIHHLDHDTDETLLELFNKDPGFNAEGKDVNNVGNKSGDKNHCTMPSRNFAIISESWSPNGPANGGPPSTANGDPAGAHTVNGSLAPPPGTANGSTHAPSSAYTQSAPSTVMSDGSPVSAPPDPKQNPRRALHDGERSCGTTHPAASGTDATGLGGRYGLDVSFRVEISPKDREGRTDGYGLSVPALEMEG
ncbi:putative transcription factor btf3 protein [Neofusicoccum parvum UCRNP2]|uniref:Putative transcription factor btf3 protein n=1 Tax=Botryosphaeria parva (strain UCR-NP2) TaxID=1287680 RepID=R1EBQ7_BOTPV|nr:putative transcription factor btf3 protein [Neofusicoccum parvum UCRNP2]